MTKLTHEGTVQGLAQRPEAGGLPVDVRGPVPVLVPRSRPPHLGHAAARTENLAREVILRHDVPAVRPR